MNKKQASSYPETRIGERLRAPQTHRFIDACLGKMLSTGKKQDIVRGRVER